MFSIWLTDNSHLLFQYTTYNLISLLDITNNCILTAILFTRSMSGRFRGNPGRGGGGGGGPPRFMMRGGGGGAPRGGFNNGPPRGRGGFQQGFSRGRGGPPRGRGGNGGFQGRQPTNMMGGDQSRGGFSNRDRGRGSFRGVASSSARPDVSICIEKSYDNSLYYNLTVLGSTTIPAASRRTETCDSTPANHYRTSPRERAGTSDFNRAGGLG